MIQSTLGVGPMSPEIVEAVFRYSNYQRKEVMLIASKNQVDHLGGYVNQWTTKDFSDHIQKLRKKYPYSEVKLCRDHCGPGFNGNFDLEDTYDTIKSDINNKFDLIHIDFCHFKGDKEQRFEESKKAIERCLQLNPNILLEVGTDENLGTNFGVMNLAEIEEEVNFFTDFCKPEFYVVQTGTLVKELNQVGDFNQSFVGKVSSVLKKKGLKLKEHNADYLSREEISLRKGIVDAMNIAPQLGAVQTSLVLNKCLIYGVKFDAFLDEVYSKEKWKKWLHINKADNKLLCALIAGHYHFSSETFKNIIEKLEKREDITENIINEMMQIIDHYHHE